jgi:hypothetical protein
VGYIPASRVRIPPSPPRRSRRLRRRLTLTGETRSPPHALLRCAFAARASPPARQSPASAACIGASRLFPRTATLSRWPNGSRRGGRAVECGGLENRFGRFRPTRVQIPPPPLLTEKSAAAMNKQPCAASRGLGIAFATPSRHDLERKCCRRSSAGRRSSLPFTPSSARSVEDRLRSYSRARRGSGNRRFGLRASSMRVPEVCASLRRDRPRPSVASLTWGWAIYSTTSSTTCSLRCLCRDAEPSRLRCSARRRRFKSLPSASQPPPTSRRPGGTRRGSLQSPRARSRRARDPSGRGRETHARWSRRDARSPSRVRRGTRGRR